MKRLQDMMLGIAIGDAFGLGYEFTGTREEIKQKFDFTKYSVNLSQDFPQTAGHYSDDTQMSIAVAETLIKNELSTPFVFVSSFLESFKRDPINGYARGFQKFLEEIAKEKNPELMFMKRIKPESERNGAAMRSVPLGVLSSKEEIAKIARNNAFYTHNTPKGLASSLAVGLLSHNALYHKKLGLSEEDSISIKSMDVESAKHFSLVSKLKEDPEFLFGRDKNGDIRDGVPCDGMRTVGAVIYLLNNYGNQPVELLKQSVLLGGDTDSTASIALGISASIHGLDSLPEFLIRDLRNDKYGKDYILGLGELLDLKYNSIPK